MAEYYAAARSNYFRVKDEAAFRRWAESRNLTIWDDTRKGIEYFAVSSQDRDGWPELAYDKHTGGCTPIILEQELAERLQEGSVAVLMETGREKLSCLVGRAVAVNSEGMTKEISLRDIYDIAKELGGEITRAEY